MEKRIKKIQDSEGFYSRHMLGIDFMQLEFVYRSIKPYFNGNLALELGPSSGQMTKYLAKDFKILHLLEASAQLLNLIPSYPNAIKHLSMIENFQTEDKFDTIIMSRVLEHIEDPVELMKKIKPWLAPGGVFIVVVPNAKSLHRIVAVNMGLLKNIYELNERDNLLGHYRVYDLENLVDDISNAGFSISQTGGSFLKPLSNSQIEESWTIEMIEGFYKAGKGFPANCAEIFVVAYG